MTSISFDNPLYLLIFIPLILLIIIPYVIAVRKSNRDKNTVASFVIHIAIALFVSLAVGGAAITTVITKTEVYVLADVSASSEKNLDKIDGYVNDLRGNLPVGGSLGVITFGKDYKLHTPLGEEFSSVVGSGVDDSATDIVSALEYAGTLFSDSVIKRIVLITDGKETNPDSAGELVRVIESLYVKGVKIDAVYLDNNISADAKEVQISDVDFTESTYLNHETGADVLIQSSYDTEAIVSLYVGEQKIQNLAVKLTKGYNIVNFDLPTDVRGNYNYTVKVSAPLDRSDKNNAYSFTQTVEGVVEVLLITTNGEDVARAEQLFGEGANITSYVNDKNVPASVEAICKFDEIVLSDVDVRELNNFTAFIDAVDTAVSVFGKSLVVMGDTKIQNKTDDVLSQLEDMLPVRFGNNDQDNKLFTIVIDTSRSMQLNYKLIMARAAAKKMIGLLSPDDYVAIVSFSGTISVAQTPIQARNHEKLYGVIDNLAPTQGTVIGAALSEAADIMLSQPFDKKQVMLISDGISYSNEADNPIEIAADLSAAGISVSALCVGEVDDSSNDSDGPSVMQHIAESGLGEYYWIIDERKLDELILGEIANDVTETIIEGRAPVNVNKRLDGVLSGVGELPDIFGYVFAKPKASATTVLTTVYNKAGGGSVSVPLYAYWSYGNGKVSSFTSTLSGEWTADWHSGAGQKLMENLFSENIPEERRDLPLDITVFYDGIKAEIEVIPINVKPSAILKLTVTMPSAESFEAEPLFEQSGYVYSFAANALGEYKIEISYSYADVEYKSTKYFNISYAPEYNSFESHDPASLYMAVRNRGTVTQGGVPSLENDESEIARYTFSLVLPLMALAAVLYIADIIIRKLKWRDILSLFGRGQGRRTR